jgi:hypothetical protein
MWMQARSCFHKLNGLTCTYNLFDGPLFPQGQRTALMRFPGAVLNREAVGQPSPGSRSAPWERGTTHRPINPERVGQGPGRSPSGFPCPTLSGLTGRCVVPLSQGALRDPGLGCPTASRLGARLAAPAEGSAAQMYTKVQIKPNNLRSPCLYHRARSYDINSEPPGLSRRCGVAESRTVI